MRSIFIFICITYLLSFSSAAQSIENVFQYLDKKFEPINDTSQAVYYRTVEVVSGSFLVTDYDKFDNSKRMEAHCSGIVPDLIYEGNSVSYYSNGQKKEEGYFTNNKRIGVFKTYYENGSVNSEILYSNNKELHIQYWSIDGHPLIQNGAGFIDAKHSISDIPLYKEIKDSIIVGSYFIGLQQKDTIFIVVDTPAEFKGGMRGMHQTIGGNLRYPAEARRSGIQGKVIVEFILTEKGEIIEKKVVRGIGGGCDEAASEVVGQLKKWEPARHHGKPVKVRMQMPIVFKIS